MHQGVILLDEFGQFRRLWLKVVERIHAADDGVEGLVGRGAQDLDVEHARGLRRFQERAVAQFEIGVGCRQARDAVRGPELRHGH